MTTHSSILAWKIPWTEEPGRLQTIESDTTERLHFTLQVSNISSDDLEKMMCIYICHGRSSAHGIYLLA